MSGSELVSHQEKQLAFSSVILYFLNVCYGQNCLQAYQKSSAGHWAQSAGQYATMMSPIPVDRSMTERKKEREEKTPQEQKALIVANGDKEKSVKERNTCNHGPIR